MNIVFLCGSLEPGRDGVGDYVRRLSGEIIRLGHHAAAVAINDRQILEEYEGFQVSDNVTIPVFRVPSTWSFRKRMDRSKRWVDLIDPEWISLQFVPYSFHKKGIPFKLHFYLSNFNKKYRWHIMFHEIWLNHPVKLKQHLIAWSQKLIVFQLNLAIKPRAIHVSIPFNQNRLKKIKIESEVLNLFGNIAKGTCERTLSLFNNSFKDILYFGTIPRDKFLKLVTIELAEYCLYSEHPVRIFIIANDSQEKNKFIEILTKKISSFQTKIIDCGFVEMDVLSTLLSKCTVGIARSEATFLGKSGSAIAMLEHGMPVWLPKWSNGTSLEITFRNQLVFSDLRKAIGASSRLEYESLLPTVAEKFIYKLNKLK